MAEQSAKKYQKFSSMENYVSEVLIKQDKIAPDNMALVLSCMDYRYPQRIVDVMNKMGLSEAYDHVILAGASLGAHVPSWRQVLVDHLGAAKILEHKIKKVVIIDHRDCGAYKEVAAPHLGLPEGFVEDVLNGGLKPDVSPGEELDYHDAVGMKLLPTIKQDFAGIIPGLLFDILLVSKTDLDIIHQES